MKGWMSGLYHFSPRHWLSPPSASQVVHPPCFQGFSILSSEGPILSLEPHLENWSLLLFLRVRHTSILTYYLQIFSMFLTGILIPTLLGEASWGTPTIGNEIHSNILPANHSHSILSYRVSAKLYSGNQASPPPPPFVQNSVFTKNLPYVLGTIPGAGNIVINRVA